MCAKIVLALRAVLALLLVGIFARDVVGVDASGDFIGQVAFSDSHQTSFDDVEVTLIGRSAIKTTTVGQDGTFRFPRLAADEYGIQVNKPGI